MTISVYPPYGATAKNAIYAQFDNNTVDAFGRLRVSNPYTLFDAQSRFAPDTSYSYVTATGGTTAYNTNQSSVSLNVTTTSGSTAVAQTYRVFPYQPGKGLLTLQTFTMAAGQANLRQRIGYFGAQNGVYLQQNGTTLAFVIRTYTSGTVDDSRIVTQANWNYDKFDGTGPSGVTLDVTKTQILWFDFEWLGVGNVRCGFVVNGTFYTAQVFQNSNFQTLVYMQTAILPLRYEIATTGTTGSSATLQMICSTVISEGGYEQVSQPYIARPGGTTGVTVGTSFVPIISMRVNSSYYGAIVIPSNYEFLPIGTGNYEIALIKNATLTGATWGSTISGGQVDIDTGATALTNTADNIVRNSFSTATNQGSTVISAQTGYNFDLQLGYPASLTGNGFASSDTYTLAARTYSGTNACTGSICFWNLTV